MKKYFCPEIQISELIVDDVIMVSIDKGDNFIDDSEFDWV